MAVPRTLRALESPTYRRYYTGQAISMIGTWVQAITLMWVAYRLTNSTAFTGLVGFLQGTPHLLLAPVAGVLGDRMPRRKILITVLTLLMIQSTVLAVLTGTGLITPPAIAFLALWAGVCNAFETPTRQSFYIQLLEKKEDLPNAIALNSILMNGSRLIGPAIGGFLIATVGETACFTINAFSYLAVLAALMGIRVVHRRPERAATNPLADLAEGWRYVMGQLPIRRMLFTLGTVSFAISPYSTLMPAIVVKTFGEGSQLVGLFIGAVGLGAMISAVSLARRPTIRGLSKWIGIAGIAAGLGAIGFSFSRTVWLSTLLMMVAGFGMFMTGAASNTIIQSIIDEDKRSRVMSYFTMFFIGSGPIGHVCAGLLAEAIGAPATFLACGAVAMVAGIAFLGQMRTFREHLRPVYIKRGIIPADPGPPTQ